MDEGRGAMDGWRVEGRGEREREIGREGFMSGGGGHVW